MNKHDILYWLLREDVSDVERLYDQADTYRRRYVGDEVHLRGLVEVSNRCTRSCLYCGLRAPNSALVRYRMTREEILSSARQARALGYGTVVLQGGEDPGLSGPFIADVVADIKALGDEPEPLAVTLSLGERSDADLRLWRQAGADRYLLRFETSNPQLFRRIHPSLPGDPSDRIAQLRRLRDMGYEIGSGAMIGVPGQSFDDLANDIMLFAELDLEMIGVGPFLPHPHTPLGTAHTAETPSQVPNSETMTYRVLALTRLACPRANIPSTTALATLNPARGRELGLKRGANVVMPNLTPPKYRRLYEIYPAKACLYEPPGDFHASLLARLAAIGRRPGRGQGGAVRET